MITSIYKAPFKQHKVALQVLNEQLNSSLFKGHSEKVSFKGRLKRLELGRDG